MSQKRVFRVCVGKGVFGETKSDFVIYDRPLIIIKLLLPLAIIIKFSTNSTITEKVSIEAASRENVIELGHQLDEKMIEVDPQRGGFRGHVCASCSTMTVVVTRCKRGRRESARRGASSTPSALTRSLLSC